MKKIHHLGIVISDIDDGLEAIGCSKSDIVEVVDDKTQKNIIYIIRASKNDLWIELVCPKEDGATTAGFAKKNVMGLHHLAFEIDKVDYVEETLREKPGFFKLGRYRPDVACFGGKMHTLFVGVGGLLLEFISKR